LRLAAWLLNVGVIPLYRGCGECWESSVTDGSSGGGGDSKRAGFLGFVAHEVRNPLSTALWSAELLSRMPAQDRSGSRGERLAAMCLRSISRVRQLVEDHFLCERLDSGGIPLRIEPILLREVVDATLARPGERGPVSVDVDPAVAVNGDRILVERAIEALIAVASAEKAPLNIEASEATRGTIALSISGHSLGRDALEDPAKGSPSDPKGRALALPLVRRIAAALGGQLAATETGYILSLPSAQGYIARPKPAAHHP
jgi:K+-sensing histidine kinase KdpD